MPLVFAKSLLACAAVASPTVELSVPDGVARPVDFSVDAAHVYFAYERFPSLDALLSRQRDGRTSAVVGIYSRSEGELKASVDLSQLWGVRPDFGPVTSRRTVSYRDGVVVAVESGPDMYLVFVDNRGTVGQRRRVQNFRVMTLGLYGEFVLAASPERLALFDENLELQHEWRPLNTLVVAQGAENDIVVLDGALDPQTFWLSGTLRWLVLTSDGLAERLAVELPIDFSPVPGPRLLAWGDRALLAGLDAGGWQECRVAARSGEVSCGEAVWGGELAAWSHAFALAGLVPSGADGYAVTVPNGCAVWARRYNSRGSTVPGQFVLPSGRSDLGVVWELLLKEWDGDAFMATAGLVNSSWREAGDYRIVLRKLALRSLEPPRPRPRIEGCSAWKDVGFGTVQEEDGGVRMLNADDVRACVARGADPNEVFNCGQWTRPLSQSAGFAGAGVVQALIAAGAEVDARDEVGETALHKAARYAKSDATLQALLDGGADPTLRDNAGRTASDYAKDNDALRDSAVLRALRDE